MTSVNQTLAECIFKRLTDTDPRGRRVRCPAGLGELAFAANVSELEVLQVLEQFRASGRHFVAIEAECGSRERRVDISHESLIRQWTQLRIWVDQERAARDRLLELVRRNERWRRGEGDLLSGVDLTLAIQWWGKAGPSRNWASRYCTRIELDGAARYLAKSRRSRGRERLLVYGVLALACAGAVGAAREAAQRNLERQRYALEEGDNLRKRLKARSAGGLKRLRGRFSSGPILPLGRAVQAPRAFSVGRPALSHRRRPLAGKTCRSDDDDGGLEHPAEDNCDEGTHTDHQSE